MIEYFPIDNRKMEFKLYDDLAAMNYKFDPSGWPTIASTINTLSQPEREVIYALIIHHAKLSGVDVNETKQPYKCGFLTPSTGSGITNSSVDNFPLELRRVISAYVTTTK